MRLSYLAYGMNEDSIHTEIDVEPSRGVMIIGMMRSGTSAVAEMVHRILCAPPPATALEPSVHNQRGFWESRRFNDLNDLVLRRIGATWAGPVATPSFEGVIDVMAKRAAQGFEAEFGTDPWVAKDPRLCLTMPFWDRVIGRFPVILVWRNPGEVARSLSAMANVPALLSEALWVRYNASGLMNSRDRRVHVVSFREAVLDPVNLAAELTAFLVSTLGRPHIETNLEYAAGAIQSDLVRQDQPAERENFEFRDATLHVIELLEQASGEGRALPSASAISPFLTVDQDILDVSRFSSVHAWDQAQALADPRVLAVLRSVLGPRDIERIDTLKRLLRKSAVLRGIGRRFMPGYD